MDASSSNTVSPFRWVRTNLTRRENFTKSISIGTVALAIIFACAVIFVRPQIEGWSISRAYIEFVSVSPLAAVRAVFVYAIGQFPRALEILPLALGSVLAGGAPIGWGIAYGFILVGKFFAAKWALGKFLAPRQVVVLSILAVVMVPWEGQWRAHNVPMQTATLFMILAVGSILRCRDKLELRSAILSPIWILMSLASYEALIIVGLALPIMVALCPGKSSWPAALARTLPLAVVPVMIFAAVSLFMLMTSTSRWTGMVNYPIHPTDHIVDAVKLLYWTALLSSPMTMIALPLYVFLLSESSHANERLKIVVLTVVFLSLLPLSAVPFMTSYSYINDAERVGISVGFGFFILCTLVCLVAKVELRSSIATVLIACTTLAAISTAYASWRPYGELQRPVLDQVKQLLKAEQGKRTLVRDTTNRLGDVFTFQHQNIFRDALFVLGIDSKFVDLCLSESPATRYIPEFIKLEFPISPVPICQPPADDVIVLDVQWKDRKPFVARMR